MPNLTYLDRVRGSLLAGAVGDAFGYPVEFRKGIFAKTKDYILPPGGDKAVISDDTQMTLFTACGILHARDLHAAGGPSPDLICEQIRYAYLDWFETQGYSAKPHPCVSKIRNVPELQVRRAPGNTCLSALDEGGGSFQRLPNSSKGCGAVMRVAPIALYGASNLRLSREEIAYIAADTSVMTHGHPLGWISSVGLCNILYDLFLGLNIADAVRETKDFLASECATYPEVATQIKLLSQAEVLAMQAKECKDYDVMDVFSVTKVLGEGWVGESALAVAVFCVLAFQFDSFERCLYNAACHDGDSDSTASIAGQIWGAAFGIQTIDSKWLDRLELRELIDEIADELVE